MAGAALSRDSDSTGVAPWPGPRCRGIRQGPHHGRGRAVEGFRFDRGRTMAGAALSRDSDSTGAAPWPGPRCRGIRQGPHHGRAALSEDSTGAAPWPGRAVEGFGFDRGRTMAGPRCRRIRIRQGSHHGRAALSRDSDSTGVAPWPGRAVEGFGFDRGHTMAGAALSRDSDSTGAAPWPGRAVEGFDRGRTLSCRPACFSWQARIHVPVGGGRQSISGWQPLCRKEVLKHSRARRARDVPVGEPVLSGVVAPGQGKDRMHAQACLADHGVQPEGGIATGRSLASGQVRPPVSRWPGAESNRWHADFQGRHNR